MKKAQIGLGISSLVKAILGWGLLAGVVQAQPGVSVAPAQPSVSVAPAQPGVPVASAQPSVSVESAGLIPAPETLGLFGKFEPIMVRTPAMQVHYEIASGSGADVVRVELWYSRGWEGQWQLYDYDEDGQSPIVFVAPGEGIYRVLVLAVDHWGRRSYQSGDKIISLLKGVIPVESMGQEVVFIDYTPPRLYLYSPRVEQQDCVSGQLLIRWSGFDRYLGARPVQLYYQKQGADNWIAISQALEAVGEFEWKLPQRLSGPIVVKAELRDIAGNKDERLSGVIKLNQSPTEPPEVSKIRVCLEGEKEQPADQGGRISGIDIEPAGGVISLERRNRAAEYFGRGNLHIQRREWEQAAQAFAKALENDPKGTAARVNLAEVLYKMGKFEQAQEQYEWCLQERPELQTVRFGLAQSQIALKQYDQAQRTLAKLLEHDRRDWQAWLMHGDVSAKLGDHKAALESWEQAANEMSPVKGQARERVEQFGF